MDLESPGLGRGTGLGTGPGICLGAGLGAGLGIAPEPVREPAWVRGPVWEDPPHHVGVIPVGDLVGSDPYLYSVLGRVPRAPARGWIY